LNKKIDYWVQMIDMISVIEELSGLTTRELSEMLKESESFVLQSKADDGGPKQVLRYNVYMYLNHILSNTCSLQVDMEKLVSSLPLHLLAVCMNLGRGSDLTYVLRGMRFLHSLSELATRHIKLEQVTSRYFTQARAFTRVWLPILSILNCDIR
jgi:hypothetical protein